MSDLFIDSSVPLVPGDAVAAILVTGGGRYLLQRRDPRADIFFPEHWGLFGGGVEAGESDEEAIRRELEEELGIVPKAMRYFTRFDFDFGFAGRKPMRRVFYEAELDDRRLGAVRLGEGAGHGLFAAREALGELRLVPYDAFALWLHASRRRLRSPG